MRKYFTLFFVFLYQIVIGQNIEITIINLVDKTPLVKASIKTVNKIGGYYTNESGKAIISANIKDTIEISYIGFKSQSFIIKKTNDTIFLQYETNVLPEITIQKFKKIKKIGDFKTNKSGWLNFGYSSEYAKKISVHAFKNKQYKVEKIFLPIRYEERNSIAKPICFLKIYSQDEQGKPGKELLKKEISLKSKKRYSKDIYIDISDKNLILTDSCIFISVECIFYGGKAIYNNDLYKPIIPKGSDFGIYSKDLDSFFDKTPNIIFRKVFELKNSLTWHSTAQNNGFGKFAVGLIISE